MELFLGIFRLDITPPIGHPLCGGWIKPVAAVDDPLEAIGFILLGAGAPIVVCAVDWCSVCNLAHRTWREAVAEAAHTTPDRVALHAVHQHNAPFVCLDAARIVAAAGDLPPVVERAFFDDCLARTRRAVMEALGRLRPVTHVAAAQANVAEVASNRRFLGPDGKVKDWRGSSAADARLRALPEGLIDPYLKTIALYEGDRKRLALHFYATHPMSFYGDGRVTSDFVGLARKRRQAEDAECLHLYLTGCAGNVAAGKYNDGTLEARQRLTDRIYRGIVDSEEALNPVPIRRVAWRTRDLRPTPRASFRADELAKRVATKEAAVANRSRPAFMLAWLQRDFSAFPITLGCLEIDGLRVLSLPAECFIEYQLLAQKLGDDKFVATAAYGDGGPWYIPTKDAYPQGGYEVTVAFCEPTVDDELAAAIGQLLT